MGNGSQLCNGSLKNQLGNHLTLKIFYKRSMGRGATNLSSLNWFGSNKICLFRKWVCNMSSWSLAFCAAIIWLGPLACPTTTLGHGSSHLISSLCQGMHPPDFFNVFSSRLLLWLGLELLAHAVFLHTSHGPPLYPDMPFSSTLNYSSNYSFPIPFNLFLGPLVLAQNSVWDGPLKVQTKVQGLSEGVLKM